MKKILVTGGAGFIGYFLVKELLKKNNKVVLVDSMLRGRMDVEFQKIISHKNIIFLQGDLTDKLFFNSLDNDFDYIYHLAALVGVKNVVENPDRVLRDNALITLNSHRIFKKHEIIKKSFIFIYKRNICRNIKTLWN